MERAWRIRFMLFHSCIRLQCLSFKCNCSQLYFLTSLALLFPCRKSTKTPPLRFTRWGWCLRRRMRPSSARVSWRRRSTSWKSREPFGSRRREMETSQSCLLCCPVWRVCRVPWWGQTGWLPVRTMQELQEACLLYLLHLLRRQSTGNVGL